MSSVQMLPGFRHCGCCVLPLESQPCLAANLLTRQHRRSERPCAPVRQDRNETLEAVARRLGRMDAKYLGEIERGWHSPTISTARRIADALEVTLSELVRDI